MYFTPDDRHQVLVARDSGDLKTCHRRPLLVPGGESDCEEDEEMELNSAATLKEIAEHLANGFGANGWADRRGCRDRRTT